MTEKSDKVLLRRYHEQGDLAAREQLIEQYMSLVRSLARRYSYRGEQLEDLVQIGDGELRTLVGPFENEVLSELEHGSGDSLDLRRILEAVCDRVEVSDGWVELTKRINGSR